MQPALVYPRVEILETWKGLLSWSAGGGIGQWQVEDRNVPNSISHAEQLLILALPTLLGLPGDLQLQVANHDKRDVLTALSGMLGAGDQRTTINQRVTTEVRRAMVTLLVEYFDTWTDGDGLPTFGGGSYVVEGEADTSTVAEVAIVDSASMAISLSVVAFLLIPEFRKYFQVDGDDETLDNLERLNALAHRRFTAALEVLVASFTVAEIDLDSPEFASYREFLSSSHGHVNGGDDAIIDKLGDRLNGVAQSLRGLDLGIRDSVFFECGWSWGPNGKGLELLKSTAGMADADLPAYVATGRESSEQAAVALPYLYFTVVALDGIVDLWSDKLRSANFVEPAERKLIDRLRECWEITSRYWSTLATLPKGEKWLIEDLPWRTSDGDESEHLTLLLLTITVGNLADLQTSASDVKRLVAVLEELGGRGRVIRRPLQDDPAIQLHDPGLKLSLELAGGEVGQPSAQWPVSNFAPQLMKQAAKMMLLAPDQQIWLRLDGFVREVWEHLRRRRLEGSSVGKSWDKRLWDDTSRVFGVPGWDSPSWYLTERTVEALVAYSRAMERPVPSAEVEDLGAAMVAELQRMVVLAVDRSESIKSDVQRQALRLQEGASGGQGTALAQAIMLLADLGRRAD